MFFLSGYIFLEFFFLIFLAPFFVFALQGVNPNLFWIETLYEVIRPEKFYQAGPKIIRIGPEKRKTIWQGGSKT